VSCFYFAFSHATLATADPSKLAGSGEAGPRPLDDQLALHLGEAGHDVKEEPSGGCLCVDAVGQAAEVHLARLERVHEIHEAFYAPPQAIELPNDQRVTGTQVRQCIIEAWANQSGTAYFVREYPVTSGLLECIQLKRKILIVRRDAGIPYWHTGADAFLCGATRWHRYSRSSRFSLRGPRFENSLSRKVCENEIFAENRFLWFGSFSLSKTTVIDQPSGKESDAAT
jgi:hypothetical protein